MNTFIKGKSDWQDDLNENFEEVTTQLLDVVHQPALNTTNTNVTNHIAKKVTDSGGIHGFSIETGTFTPVLSGETIAGVNTYSQQIGYYVKQGNLVHIDIFLGITAKDSAMAGNLTIKNLPFVNNNGAIIGCSLGACVGITRNTKQVVADIPVGLNYIRLAMLNDSSVVMFQPTDIANSTIIVLSATYKI